jgi:hypothetical protein
MPLYGNKAIFYQQFNSGRIYGNEIFGKYSKPLPNMVIDQPLEFQNGKKRSGESKSTIVDCEIGMSEKEILQMEKFIIPIQASLEARAKELWILQVLLFLTHRKIFFHLLFPNLLVSVLRAQLSLKI